MILVHTMQGEKMYINPHMIETIRVTPDTVLFLNTNKRVIVRDSATDIVARIIEYRHAIADRATTPGRLIAAEHSEDYNE